MSNLAVRLLTAAVVVPIVLAGLLLAPPVATLVMAVVAAAAGSYEILGLFKHKRPTAARIAGTCLGASAVILVYVAGRDPAHLLMSVIAVLAAALLLGIVCRGDMEHAGSRTAGLVLASLYPGLLLSLLALMRRDVTDGALWVVLCLMTAFLSDTGAYFAGRFLGRHKLAPRLSPSKTVEGSVGGFAAALAACVAARYTFLPSLPLSDAVLLGILGSAVGQAGDLVESMLKRSADAKDTGGFFPGHGGMMDRIDAAIFVAALFYGYLVLWGGPR